MIFGIVEYLMSEDFCFKKKLKRSQNALIKCLSFYFHPKIEQI
jgi:hypothetical protein